MTKSKLELHLMTFEQLRDQLIKMFQSVRYSKGVYSFFAEWAEIAAITVHQFPYHAGLIPKDDEFKLYEDKYMAAIKGMAKDTLTLIAHIFGLVQFGMERFERDLLGPVYMGLEIGNRRGGQFFTPEHICDLMAGLTFTDFSVFDTKPAGERVRIQEPASGSGGMLISVVRKLKERGIVHQFRVWVDCIDVSRNAFNMTYIQLGMLGVCGIVRHGNTLSLEMFEERLLPQALICRYQASEQGQAEIKRWQAIKAFALLLEPNATVKAVAEVPSDVALPKPDDTEWFEF